MVSIEVDVDLENFDDEEVIEYAIDRLLRLKSINRGKQLEQIKDILSDLFEDENDEKIFPVTLEDQMKLEHIRNVFHTYSLWEILKLIPEKNTL